MLTLDASNYLNFYFNTVDGFSVQMKRQIVADLEQKHLITFHKQKNLLDAAHCMYFQKKDYRYICQKTSQNINFLSFYDKLDFLKMYQYSVPFFYEGEIENRFKKLLDSGKEIQNCGDYNNKIEFSIASEIEESIPVFYKIDAQHFMVKFVVHQNYYKDQSQKIDYRYIVVVYFDETNKMFEIRYDRLKQSYSAHNKGTYRDNIFFIIEWLKEKLQVKIFRCDNKNFWNIVKNDEQSHVRIFKQMMDMGSSGAAELTASQDEDFILPFIGEIR